MYHFSNQQIYHHNAYEQCPIFIDHPKQHVVVSSTHTSTQYNQFEPVLPQTVVSRPSDNVQRQQEIHQEPKKPDKIKKKETSRTSVDTSNFSIEERLVAAVWVHERKRTKTSMNQIKLEFRHRFGRDPPAKNTLLVWERKLFSTGSVCDAPRPGRPVNRRSRVDEVAASVRAAPALSLRARALALRVPRTTLRTILHKDLSHTNNRNIDVSQKPTAGKPQLQKMKRQVSRKPQPQAPREGAAAPPQHYAPIPHNMHTHTTYT